jgi:hypothetical protein
MQAKQGPRTAWVAAIGQCHLQAAAHDCPEAASRMVLGRPMGEQFWRPSLVPDLALPSTLPPMGLPPSEALERPNLGPRAAGRSRVTLDAVRSMKTGGERVGRPISAGTRQESGWLMGEETGGNGFCPAMRAMSTADGGSQRDGRDQPEVEYGRHLAVCIPSLTVIVRQSINGFQNGPPITMAAAGADGTPATEKKYLPR